MTHWPKDLSASFIAEEGAALKSGVLTLLQQRGACRAAGKMSETEMRPVYWRLIYYSGGLYMLGYKKQALKEKAFWKIVVTGCSTNLTLPEAFPASDNHLSIQSDQTITFLQAENSNQRDEWVELIWDSLQPRACRTYESDPPGRGHPVCRGRTSQSMTDHGVNSVRAECLRLRRVQTERSVRHLDLASAHDMPPKVHQYGLAHRGDPTERGLSVPGVSLHASYDNLHDSMVPDPISVNFVEHYYESDSLQPPRHAGHLHKSDTDVHASALLEDAALSRASTRSDSVGMEYYCNVSQEDPRNAGRRRGDGCVASRAEPDQPTYVNTRNMWRVKAEEAAAAPEALAPPLLPFRAHPRSPDGTSGPTTCFRAQVRVQTGAQTETKGQVETTAKANDRGSEGTQTGSESGVDDAEQDYLTTPTGNDTIDDFVRKLREERHSAAGVLVSLPGRDLTPDSIRLVFYNGLLCVAGVPCARLHPKLHVDDAILKINGKPPGAVHSCYKLFRESDEAEVELTVSRVVHGAILQLSLPRDCDMTSLGLLFGNKNQGNQVTTIRSRKFEAQMDKLSKLAFKDMEENWCLTEINGTPLSLYITPAEVQTQLCAAGRKLALVFVPPDIPQNFKEKLFSSTRRTTLGFYNV